MNSRRAIIALFVLMMLAFYGCRFTAPYQLSIYNDDAKIAQPGDSYSFNQRVGRTVANQLSLQFSGFTGKRTIWSIAAGQDCVLELDLNNEITTGDFKVCLIDPGRKISIISEGSQAGLISVNVPRGDNELTIVGSEAAGKIDMTLRYNVKASIIPVEHLNR
ncbi:MAG: hypothetical protein ABRQ24_08265 [Syntrophomonadaceae bacterium]